MKKETKKSRLGTLC